MACSTVHVLPEEHSYNGQKRLRYIGPVLDVKATGNQFYNKTVQ